LRHTYREDGKVKHLTVGNLSDLPDDLIEVIRKRLAGQPLPAEGDDCQIVRSLPHGHVAAVLGTLRKIGVGIDRGQWRAGVPLKSDSLPVAPVWRDSSVQHGQMMNHCSRRLGPIQVSLTRTGPH